MMESKYTIHAVHGERNCRHELHHSFTCIVCWRNVCWCAGCYDDVERQVKEMISPTLAEDTSICNDCWSAVGGEHVSVVQSGELGSRPMRYDYTTYQNWI